MKHSSQLPTSLKLETVAICYSGALLPILFAVFLLNLWSLQETLTWLIQTEFIWLLVTYRVNKLLYLNRSSRQEEIYSKLGWANRLTLLRGFLIAITGGFIFQPNLNETVLLIPALSYFFAAIIDRVDGYIARLTMHESLLGTALDIESDALGLLIAPSLAIWIGQIHWSYLSVSLAYYLFQWGLYWRLKHNKPICQLPPNMSRRAIAGFQMGFLAVVLWPVLAPPATMIAGLAFMLPLLVGFIMDWLTLSGRIKIDDPLTKSLLHQLNKALHLVILPMLRVLIILLLCLILIRINYFSLLTVGDGFYHINSTLLIGLLFSGVMILFGVNGRFFAIILSCLLCWCFITYDIQVLDGVLLVSVIWVMQFGTGKFSLWVWDDNWVNRYDGA